MRTFACPCRQSAACVGFKNVILNVLWRMIQLCHSFRSELNFWSCGYTLWMSSIVALCWEITEGAVCFFSWREAPQPRRQEHWAQPTPWTTLRWAAPTGTEPRDKEADCTTPSCRLEGIGHPWIWVYRGTGNYTVPLNPCCLCLLWPSLTITRHCLKPPPGSSRLSFLIKL